MHSVLGIIEDVFETREGSHSWKYKNDFYISRVNRRPGTEVRRVNICLCRVVIMCNNWHNFLWSIREDNGVVPGLVPLSSPLCMQCVGCHNVASRLPPPANHLNVRGLTCISVAGSRYWDNINREDQQPAGHLQARWDTEVTEADRVGDQGRHGQDW